MRRKPDHFRPERNYENSHRSTIIVWNGVKRKTITVEEKILSLAFKRAVYLPNEIIEVRRKIICIPG
jgi:hypothetical protein